MRNITTTTTIEGRPILACIAPPETPTTMVMDAPLHDATPRESAAAAAALVAVGVATGAPVHAYTPHGGVWLLVVDTGNGRGLALVWDATTGRRTAVREVVRPSTSPDGWNVAGAESLAYVTRDAATRAADHGATVIEELRVVATPVV
jgi:hypothetical protein